MRRLQFRLSPYVDARHYQPFLAAVAPTLMHLQWEYAGVLSYLYISRLRCGEHARSDLCALVPPSLHLPHMPLVLTLELNIIIQHDGLQPDFASTLRRIAASLPNIQRLVLYGLLRYGAGDEWHMRPTGADPGVELPALRNVDFQLVPHGVAHSRSPDELERAVLLRQCCRAMEALIPALRETVHMRCVFCPPRENILHRVLS
jgi:hypothetical protein